MQIGLDLEKILLIGLVAALLLGPERLPVYAAALTRFIRRGKVWLDGAKERVREEMGDEFDDIEWQKLDPRQYDPRRIIREALIDDAPLPANRSTPPAAAPTALAASAEQVRPARRDPDAPVPFDSEAT